MTWLLVSNLLLLAVLGALALVVLSLARQIGILHERTAPLGLVSKSQGVDCLLYTSPSPRDVEESRMPSSA